MKLRPPEFRDCTYSLSLQMTLDSMEEKDFPLPGTRSDLVLKPSHLNVPLAKQPSFSVLSLCLCKSGITKTAP